jgi:hypothetical protein
MEGLPPAQTDTHPLRTEAGEAAIRVTRENGRVQARGERSRGAPASGRDAAPGGNRLSNHRTEEERRDG